jgi:Mitochondrial carrier protein
MVYNGASGVIAGLSAIVFMYPLDVTRRLMQLNGTRGH